MGFGEKTSIVMMVYLTDWVVLMIVQEWLKDIYVTEDGEVRVNVN